MLPVRVSCGSVLLRPIVLEDAGRVARLCDDREVAEMTALVPYPYSAALAQAWIATLAPPTSNALQYVYAVGRRDDELLIGAVGLNVEPAAHDTVGYWIGRPYWGRGHATDAASAAIALAFTQLGLREVHATHLARNPASGRVLAKCGLREVRREERPHRDGPAGTFVVWSLERDAWRAWIETREAG